MSASQADAIADAIALTAAGLARDAEAERVILDHADCPQVAAVLAGMLGTALTSIARAFGEESADALLDRMRAALCRYEDRSRP